MESSNKESKSNLISLDEKTLTAIQLLKNVRKEIAEYRKKEGIVEEPSSSNSAEINAYKAVEEVLPRMMITPMLSAQIERHKDSINFSLKEQELTKQIKELRAENKELKEEIATVNAKNGKINAELSNVQDIIKGLGLDKVPEGIPPTFRQLIETRSRKIVKLEGVIKEITKEKEALAKQLSELKDSSMELEKSSDKLQGKELLEIEALLDEPDETNDNLITSASEESAAPSLTRKRLWQNLCEAAPNALVEQITKKYHNDDDNNKGGIDKTCAAQDQAEISENQDKTKTF
uniref:Uncharacterized protein n=1 Tax=Panagrolaimus sp. ES5 TaxID=591445 RepID=A0AC34GPI0_9BILA